MDKTASDARNRFAIPLDIEPMEARSADMLPSGDIWQFEPKWDGFRCLAFKSGDWIELKAKSGKSLSRYFPEVVTSLRGLPFDRFVVDGELVVEFEGQFSFSALQMRLHPAESRIRKLSVATPAKLVLFDVLISSDGAVLLEQPFFVRRRALTAFVAQAGASAIVQLSPSTSDRAKAQRWLDDLGRGDIDGVVAKRGDGLYEPGVRAMIKVKPLRTADCVVGGYRYEASSRLVGSLLLGLYDDAGKLNHVGYTSSIARADRPALTRKLEDLREAPGFTGRAPGGPSRWVKDGSDKWEPLRPELVVEVKFDRVTDSRFRHGTKFLRFRPDKSPRQCTLDQFGNVAARQNVQQEP